MKICIIDQGELYGGAERFTIDLIKYTSKSKVDFTVLFDENADSHYKKDLEEIPYLKKFAVPLPSMSPSILSSYPKALISSAKIKSVIKKVDPDVLQSNTIRAHVVGSMAAKSLGIPLVWVMHDFTFPEKYLKKFVDVPAKIICVSEAVKQHLLTICPAIDPEKLVIIPNGVHSERSKSEEPYTNILDIDGDSFSFDSKKRYVGLIGRIDTWKGQDIFLRTIDILQHEYRQHENVEYCIIGDVTQTAPEKLAYYQDLRNYVKEHNINNVHFLGHKESLRILKNLCILVHASTEKEPFGRTIIEAFSVGVPVIATKIGGPAEIISYGVNGLLCEPKDPQDLAQKISLLLEDNHLCETLKMNGKKDVRAKYHIEKVVEAFYALWCNIKK